MGVVIKKIQLKNWFGYKGDYEANTFDFSDGVNIIVATNDVGKSKLHNAFRWIIEDKVILKNNQTNKHEVVKINPDNIGSILNYFVANQLKNEENVSIGVKLTYELTNSRGTTVRVLTKEILCSKDVNRIISAEPTYKVEKIENGNIRSDIMSFEECLKRLMRKNLKDYFLVQGENVENLTPLKGERLANTINLLVELNTLDDKHTVSENLSNSLRLLKNQIEMRDNRNNERARKNIERKEVLENEILEIENKTLVELEEFIIENKTIITQFSAQADNAKARIALKKELDEFNEKIRYHEGVLNTKYKEFTNNCINGNFWISKLTDNSEEKKALNYISTEMREYVAKRRAELDERLTKTEQKMLAALERDQPSPVILEQMVEEGNCYVCSQELEGESKNYITEKLIPYFKKEFNHDDQELKILEEIYELFKKSQGYLSKFSSFEETYVLSLKAGIIESEKEIREYEDAKTDFLNINGSIEDSKDDEINLHTYNKAVRDLENLKNEKQEIENTLKSKKTELNNIEINTLRDNASHQFRKAEKLYDFSTLLNEYLLRLKNEEYSAFCVRLEEIANIKWKAFTKSNRGLNSQSIKVEFSINSAKKPDFEIKVVDRFGNNQQDGGGASQSIRQLSVIFALVEIAAGNVDYPFIADAPTSNATPALTEDFFVYQLENATNQNILITKELWDDHSNNLNKVGKSLLETVKNSDNARLITIINGERNNKIINKL